MTSTSLTFVNYCTTPITVTPPGGTASSIAVGAEVTSI